MRLRPGGVVEVVPVDGPEQRHLAEAVPWQGEILAELLAFPEHGDALGAQQADQVRLQLVPAVLVAEREQVLPASSGWIVPNAASRRGWS